MKALAALDAYGNGQEGLLYWTGMEARRSIMLELYAHQVPTGQVTMCPTNALMMQVLDHSST